MKLKNIEIKNPVILAPQAGITDLPFRNLVSSFGGKEYSTSLTVSEMVPSASQVYLLNRKKGNDKIKRLYERYSSDTLTSVQIFGNDPEIMGESAKINEELGADIIDINMGCPVNKIVKNGCGSDLLRNPDLASKIIRKVVDSVKIPVSVKIRAGWDFNHKNAPDFAKMIEDSGASMVAIHGRTRSQLYSGHADLNIIKDVKSSVSIPVVGNGDIFTVEDAKNMLEYTGVDGVMVGRGIYGAPWFLYHIVYFLKTGEKLPEPTVSEKKDILLKHISAMIDYYGEKTGMFNARKHIAWYSKGLRNSAEFRNFVNNSENINEVYEFIEKLFK
ncbi:MAG: tRNA dihydrouridine synthase DusB [bacterium]|nr:tRNA dihydrouridine synthase DusB [bacterium]